MYLSVGGSWSSSEAFIYLFKSLMDGQAGGVPSSPTRGTGPTAAFHGIPATPMPSHICPDVVASKGVIPCVFLRLQQHAPGH